MCTVSLTVEIKAAFSNSFGLVSGRWCHEVDHSSRIYLLLRYGILNDKLKAKGGFL